MCCIAATITPTPRSKKRFTLLSQARYPSFSGCEMPLFRSIPGSSDTFDRRFDQRNPTLSSSCIEVCENCHIEAVENLNCPKMNREARQVFPK
jgi:hypothetical protein